MTWEPLLLGLIVAILGTAALVYGTMCWKFTCKDLGKFILIIALVVAALISGTMTWGLTGKVLLAAMTWEHLLPALIVAILGTAALVYGTMRWEFTWTDLLIFVLIALGIAVLIYGTVIWGSTGKGLPAVTTWADFLPTFIGALVGTIPGTLAVILILRDRLTSYLHVTLRVDLNESGFLSAMAEVENKSIGKKDLSKALLLVGPEHECPVKTMHQLGFKDVKETDDIVKGERHSRTGPNGRSLILLPFFYCENEGIADEKVSYRAPIDTHYIPKGVPYSVRFFISTPERPHRSTHDSFVLPPPAP